MSYWEENRNSSDLSFRCHCKSLHVVHSHFWKSSSASHDHPQLHTHFYLQFPNIHEYIYEYIHAYIYLKIFLWMCSVTLVIIGIRVRSLHLVSQTFYRGYAYILNPVYEEQRVIRKKSKQRNLWPQLITSTWHIWISSPLNQCLIKSQPKA